MLTSNREMDQRTIQLSYNRFVDKLKNNYPELEKLREGGSCFGLSIYYAFHFSKNNHRYVFLPYLKFFYSLRNLTFFDNAVSQIRYTGKVNFIDDSGLFVLISIGEIIWFIKNVNALQKRSFSVLPAIWEKNYAFICHKNQLADALFFIFQHNNYKMILFALSRHIFFAAHVLQGFYLFESNHINIYAEFPLIKSTHELSEQILINCKSKITENQLVSFQLLSISFDNDHPYKKFIEQNGEIIQHLNAYHSWTDLIEGRLSYFDFFELLSDQAKKLHTDADQPISGQLKLFELSLDRYLAEDIKIVSNLLTLSLHHLHDSAFNHRYSFLLSISAMNYVSLIKKLIALNVDINQRITDIKLFPLYFAAQNNFYDLAQLLIANAANVNQSVADGSSPLYVATNRHHYQMVDLLIKNHALVNQKQEVGSVPLHLACQKGDLFMANLLIANHANVNAKLTQGATPLELAIQFNHLEIVKLLLANNGKSSKTYLKRPIIAHAYHQLILDEILKYEFADVSLLQKWVMKDAINLNQTIFQYGCEILTIAEQLLALACFFQSTKLLKGVITKTPEINQEMNIDRILLLTLPHFKFNEAKKWIMKELNTFASSLRHPIRNIARPLLPVIESPITKTSATLFYNYKTIGHYSSVLKKHPIQFKHEHDNKRRCIR